MPFLILVGLSLTLLGAFLLLTAVEGKYGRIAPNSRSKFDKLVVRASFIARHVDWAGFLKHVVNSTTERIAHDVAHAALLVTRLVERLLTRMVRSLRERRSDMHLPRASRQRVPLRETLQAFRKTLVRVSEKKERSSKDT